MGGLWNCQSAVKKAESISAYPSLITLPFLAFTETWITRENSAAPAGLSTAYSFSQNTRPSEREGGTGLLISPKWSYQVLPLEHITRSEFELHAVLQSLFATSTMNMDVLLSCPPENGTPLLVVLDDFNILPKKLHPPELTKFFATFDLTLTPSPPKHRAGKQPNLIFMRSCGTLALSVTPLPVSDHQFVFFSLPK